MISDGKRTFLSWLSLEDSKRHSFSGDSLRTRRNKTLLFPLRTDFAVGFKMIIFHSRKMSREAKERFGEIAPVFETKEEKNGLTPIFTCR